MKKNLAAALLVTLLSAPSALANDGSKFKVVCVSVTADTSPSDGINEQLAAIPNIISVSAPALSPDGPNLYGELCVTVQYHD